MVLRELNLLQMRRQASASSSWKINWTSVQLNLDRQTNYMSLLVSRSIHRAYFLWGFLRSEGGREISIQKKRHNFRGVCTKNNPPHHRTKVLQSDQNVYVWQLHNLEFTIYKFITKSQNPWKLRRLNWHFSLGETSNLIGHGFANSTCWNIFTSSPTWHMPRLKKKVSYKNEQVYTCNAHRFESHFSYSEMVLFHLNG
jgi:hypothetical protein